MDMLKWIGRILLGLGGLLVVFIAVIQVKFKSQQNERISFTPEAITIPDDSESLAEGRRLVQLKGCYDCHGTDLTGRLFADAGPVGRYVGSNLTPAGVTADYEDVDWIRAIRYGLNPEGRKLVFMPSAEYAQLSNEDLGKIIAYLKSVPSAKSENPLLEIGPMAKVLYLAGKFPLMFQAELIDRNLKPVESIAPDTSVKYGAYLAASCTGCHGMDMKGGPIPGVPPEWPPAADLTSTGTARSWSKADFEKVIRTGVKPNGRTINPAFMPWTSFAAMNDMEMTAIYNYIQSL